MATVNERLIKAARHGDEEELKILLDQPTCDTTFKDSQGLTALMCAASGGHSTCVRWLLPLSDPKSRDNDGMTALTNAAWFGHEGCVKLLLPVSDPLATDAGGMTALMRAAGSAHEGCVRILLPASNPLAKNADGVTVSSWARQCGHEILAQFIDAYIQAQGDSCTIEVALGPVVPRGRLARRV